MLARYFCTTEWIVTYCICDNKFITRLIFQSNSGCLLYFMCVLFLAEYIVTFNGYYLNETRHNYISAALRSAGVENWRILDRNNAASKYPSDFDVLFVNIN